MYTEEQSDIHNFVLSELEKISVLLRFLLNHCWTRNINGKEQYKKKNNSLGATSAPKLRTTQRDFTLY